jgi:hypothetical protein
LAAGAATVCAVAFDGSVWCWGANSSGQLGAASPLDVDRPVRVEGVAGALQVVVGDRSVCAVGEAGRTTCWGGPRRSPPSEGPIAQAAGAGGRDTPVALGDATFCRLGDPDEVVCSDVPVG